MFVAYGMAILLDVIQRLFEEILHPQK